MTVSLQLGSMLYSCPANWINFINDLRKRGVNQNSTHGFDIDTLNQELSRFKAQYVDGVNLPSRIDFKNEKYYNLFVLRYGGE